MNFKGDTIVEREGLILSVQDINGCLHYADIAPLINFSQETLAQATAEITAFVQLGLSALNNQKINQCIKRCSASVQFALTSIFIKSDSELLNTKIVPLLQGNKQSVISEYQRLNQPNIIKLKVAKNSLEDDIKIINSLSLLNPKIQLRLDANQQWTPSQVACFLEKVSVINIDYLEEATPLHADNLSLAKQFNLHIALDETLQNPLFNYQAARHIRALVIKPTLVGSLARIDAFMKIARRHDLSVNMSSSFESAVGISILKKMAARYQNEVDITLGIDTQKQFESAFMMIEENIAQDIKQLECVWKS